MVHDAVRHVSDLPWLMSGDEEDILHPEGAWLYGDVMRIDDVDSIDQE